MLVKFPKAVWTRILEKAHFLRWHLVATSPGLAARRKLRTGSGKVPKKERSPLPFSSRRPRIMSHNGEAADDRMELLLDFQFLKPIDQKVETKRWETPSVKIFVVFCSHDLMVGSCGTCWKWSNCAPVSPTQIGGGIGSDLFFWMCSDGWAK